MRYSPKPPPREEARRGQASQKPKRVSPGQRGAENGKTSSPTHGRRNARPQRNSEGLRRKGPSHWQPASGPQIAVKRPVLDRFSDVRRLDRSAPFEIRNGPRDLEDAV